MPQKKVFGRIECCYCIPTVFFHATTFKKNSQRANNKTEGCKILAQTGCELLPQIRFLWKSWLASLAIISHHAMSNQNIHQRIDHEYKDV